MTNIKALAEQVKKNYEAQPDWAEHKIENVSYKLASALLRVMGDINKIDKAWKARLPYEDESGVFRLTLQDSAKITEALDKLMEELGGE